MTRHSTPQDAADRLLDATDATPPDRAFLAWFAGVFVLVVLAGASASYVLNPYGRFTPTMFAPRVTLDRDKKLSLWRTLPSPAEVVIVGSSHVKKLDPVCITYLTGHSAFNFGVDGGSLDDIRTIFRIVEPMRPREILLGIDPTVLSTTNTINRPSLWAREFSAYVDAGFEDRFDVLGEILWSQSALIDDWAVFRRGRSHPRSHFFRADGFWETPKDDAAQRDGTFDLASRVASSANRLAPIYRAANVDPARLAQLRATLVEAKRHGIETTVFMPPLHPSLAARLAIDHGYVNATIELDTALRTFHEEGLARYVRAPLASFGTPYDFVDADHMNAINATRLVEHIYGRRGECAVQ